MATIEEVSTAVNDSLHRVNENYVIKPKQLQSILKLVNGKDVLAVLPTSYGKSLIFQMLPSIYRFLGLVEYPVVVVVAPYRSLIQDQIAEALKHNESLGLSPCSLQNVSPEELCCDKFNLIIDTPESWLDDSRWRNVLSSTFFRKNLICIVVDEAHKVSWGVPSPETGKAFREAFSQINTLRSFCDGKVPVLALSATVDQDLSHLISHCCGLSSNKVHTIYSASDRPNIRLSVVKLKSKDVTCFEWLKKELCEKGENSPKILIYCRTQTLVGWLFEQFLIMLKEFAYKNRVAKNENLLIGMYHSCTLDSNKKKVLNSLTEDGVTRVIIATSALGCGINAKNLQYVLHFGPAFSLVDYCQQIGRAGRCGEPECHAVLYSFPQGNAPIHETMKHYIYSYDQVCLRSTLFSPFNEENQTVPPQKPAKFCCSYCAKNSPQNSLEEYIPFPFESVAVADVKHQPAKLFEMSDNDKQNLKIKFRNLHSDTCANNLLHVPSGVVSGLTSSIIDEIADHVVFADGPQYYFQNLNVSYEVAIKVDEIVKKYFGETLSPSPKKRNVESESTDVIKDYVFSDFSSGEEDFFDTSNL